MHIYLNEETASKLKRLANSGIYKKKSSSYVIKHLIEKEEKYTDTTIRKIEDNKKQEEEIIKKFGSIERAIELANQDWVNE